jgi:RNA polymerase sigma-70 factor (ECF subfamily)
VKQSERSLKVESTAAADKCAQGHASAALRSPSTTFNNASILPSVGRVKIGQQFSEKVCAAPAAVVKSLSRPWTRGREMAPSESDPESILRLLERVGAGDHDAEEELLRHVRPRLERLAGVIFRSYPRLRGWVEMDDIFQGATLRLVNALRQLTPRSDREFFRLAAAQMRRELIDRTRQLFGARGHGANLSADPVTEDEIDLRAESATVADYIAQQENWTDFHEAIMRLPAAEREAVCLHIYVELTSAEVAEILQVDERTARRYWRSAIKKLAGNLGRLREGGGE